MWVALWAFSKQWGIITYDFNVTGCIKMAVVNKKKKRIVYRGKKRQNKKTGKKCIFSIACLYFLKSEIGFWQVSLRHEIHSAHKLSRKLLNFWMEYKTKQNKKKANISQLVQFYMVQPQLHEIDSILFNTIPPFIGQVHPEEKTRHHKGHKKVWSCISQSLHITVGVLATLLTLQLFHTWLAP